MKKCFGLLGFLLLLLLCPSILAEESGTGHSFKLHIRDESNSGSVYMRFDVFLDELQSFILACPDQGTDYIELEFDADSLSGYKEPADLNKFRMECYLGYSDQDPESAVLQAYSGEDVDQKRIADLSFTPEWGGLYEYRVVKGDPEEDFIFEELKPDMETPEGFSFSDQIPSEYLSLAEERGTIERVEYTTRDYLGDEAEITKHAFVYLPYGYTEEKQYDVLILCHGIGGNEYEWGFGKTFGPAINIMDNLIAKGMIRPMIVVTPNCRSSKDFSKTSMDNADGFYVFGKELRNDLLPWIDAHYSTYGSQNPDDLSAARGHRAIAGLSMGGMQTINIGLCECLDLFGCFGAFSAAPTSYTASEIAQKVEEFPDEPVLYFYSICGTEDDLYFAGAAAAKDLPEYSDRFTEKNWHWQERSGGHNFAIWNLGLYNFVRVFGNI